MSLYKPYPKYKDSGVEWLGQMPEGWEVLPLKYIASMKSGEQIASDAIEAEGEFPVYGGNGLRGYTTDFTHEGHYPLVGRQGALCGNINYAREKFWASEHAVVVTPTRQISVLWLGELLRSMNLGQYSISAAQPGLAVETIANLQITLPPLSEQQAIADFLDRETAHIDVLISKQKRLIELLQEKRVALISHVVTKGLNPGAPMKDSGVEWLGEVPEHWQVLPLKRIIARIESGTSVNAIDIPVENGGIGVLKTSCVYKGFFDVTENKIVIKEEVERVSCRLRAGTLIVSRMNTPSLVGATGVVKDDTENIYLPDRLWQVHFHSDVSYVYYYTLTDYYRKQIQASCSGTSASMQNLGQNDFGNVVIAIPHHHEQQAIVDFLDRETAKIDTLIAKAQRAITLAQEHRSALISAAVTGKICVTRSQAEVQPLSKSREYFQKVVLAAEITSRLHQEPSFGRVKLQKILYLSEYHAQLPFQRSEYQRYAAGPHDPKALYAIEGQMKKQKWFDSKPREGGYGKMYVPMERHDAYRQYYERYFSGTHEKIQQIIELLRTEKTQFCEVVATLYGVWNDFLLHGQSFDESAIIEDARTNWAPEKQSVPQHLWPAALQWMKKHGLTPVGWGEPTIHRGEL